MRFAAFFSNRRKRERQAYGKVAKEIVRGIRSEGLWLKAMSQADFDQVAAKSIYVQLRVESILDEWDDNAASAKVSERSKYESQETSEVLKKQSHDLSSNRKRKAKLILKGALWIAAGAVVYQAFGWFVLGRNFSLNPLDFASNLYFSLLLVGDGGTTTAILALQFAMLGFFVLKGVNTLRSRHQVAARTDDLPVTHKPPKNQ